MADLFYLPFFHQAYQEFNNLNPAVRILIGRSGRINGHISGIALVILNQILQGYEIP
jgi:hypothetical protein